MKQWSEQLFGCTESIPLCLLGFLYPCGPAALQGAAVYELTSGWAAAVGMGCFGCVCPCVGIGINRCWIRNKLGIQGNAAFDMCFGLFLSCCSAVQDYREVKTAQTRKHV